MRFSLRTEAALLAPVDALCRERWSSADGFISRGPFSAEPHLCVAAGTMCDADGEPHDGAREVIGFVRSSKAPRRGEVVSVEMQPFVKPRGVSWDGAARLPLLLLTACAALDRVGVHMGGNHAGKTVMVAGSSGPLPPLLASLIDYRGAQPLVVGTGPALSRIASQNRRSHIDGSGCKVSTLDFHDALLGSSISSLIAPAPTSSADFVLGLENTGPFDGELGGVIDVIGCEDEPWLIEERWGVSYVSIASNSLKRAISEGALAEAGRMLSTMSINMRHSAPANENSDYPYGSPADGIISGGLHGVWMPNETSISVLRKSLSLIDSGAVHTPKEMRQSKSEVGLSLGNMLSSKVAQLGSHASGTGRSMSTSMHALRELVDQYFEYHSWPRDMDTGGRSGFPGRDLWAPLDTWRASHQREGFVQVDR
eukprot:scaffold294951_cov32-Tisochrysis_lutea.AAC.1